MADICISGMGIVSALGNNVGETLAALRAQKSGIGPMRYLKTSHTEFPVGEVKMSNEEMMGLLGIPTETPTTRTSLMGMLAVRETLVGAGLAPAPAQRRGQPVGAGLAPALSQRASQWTLQRASQRSGQPQGLPQRCTAFISGTTVGGMDKSEQFYLDFLENDTKNAYISTHDCGACTEMIADHFGIFSQVDTISTACSSAANAILLGAELLQSGRADMVVAGGCECISKFHLNGFNTLMILDPNRCRPFDATRVGLNLGEGAAYVVLETIESAHERGVTPLCRLSGYANTCDAYHQTASSPDGEGAYLAMKKALENANLTPDQIDYINAHGTGTTNNDVSEGTAIMRLFGNEIPPVSSTKSFTGHTTSAAGAVETVISILALQHHFIPVNLNFMHQMPELSFSPATNPHPVTPMAHILCNSFGFGGNNTSLIFSKI